MAEEDDDFDAEKTQIFLPGGGRSAAPDHTTRDREGIQLKPKGDAPADAATPPATDADGDVTGGGAPKHAPPAPPAPASGSALGTVAVLLVIAVVVVVGFLLLR